MIEKTTLKKAFGETLHDAGFVSKSGSWYRSGSDAVVVLNLQKSDFGNYFYLNVGINLKALSDEPFPKSNQCHIGIRADNLVAEDDVLPLNMGINLDEGDDQYLKGFIDLMNMKVLPLIGEFLRLQQLREHYKKLTFKKALLFWQARELLEMPITSK